MRSKKSQEDKIIAELEEFARKESEKDDISLAKINHVR